MHIYTNYIIIAAIEKSMFMARNSLGRAIWWGQQWIANINEIPFCNVSPWIKERFITNMYNQLPNEISDFQPCTRAIVIYIIEITRFDKCFYHMKLDCAWNVLEIPRHIISIIMFEHLYWIGVLPSTSKSKQTNLFHLSAFLWETAGLCTHYVITFQKWKEKTIPLRS